MDASEIRTLGSMWSGTDVCSASCCGFTNAAGPYGDSRIGSNTLTLRVTVWLLNDREIGLRVLAGPAQDGPRTLLAAHDVVPGEP